MLRIAHIAALLTACPALPAMAQHAGVSDTELAARFSINGVRISSGNRIALVNNQLLRVGEIVGAAEVIAIESNAVHLRVANRSFAMRVGSSLIRESQYANEPDSGSLANESESSEASSIESTARSKTETVVDVDTNRQPTIAVASTLETKSTPPKLATVEALTVSESIIAPVIEHEPPFEPDLPGFAESDVYGPVAPGETLSEIAASLAHDRSDAAAMMRALYEHNPEAFGDSMDLLYAGTELQIPEIAPATPAGGRLAAAAAPRAPPADGGPKLPRFVTVQPGDTLSEIAASLAIANMTLNQAMLGIYAANPAAFGGNLNRLYAGEILQIPDAAALRVHDAQTAISEVARHAALWHGVNHPANST